MPSPSRPPKGSPPRRALHERTESQTNERSLRLVGDPQAPVYGSPFPTKPSQILSPKGYNVQGSSVGVEPGVSHGRNTPRETRSYIEGSSGILKPRDIQSSHASRESDDVPSKRQSPTKPPLDKSFANISNADTKTSFLLMDQQDEEAGRMSDDIVQLPSVPLKKDTVGAPASGSPTALERQLVQTKDSESSLSSTNSTGTVIVKKNRDGKKRASYSAFPNIRRSSFSKSSSSLSSPHKPVVEESSGQHQPTVPASPSSSASSSFEPAAERRTSSAPMYANLQAASQSSLNIQYPVIRPPSASASWVEPPNVASQITQRTIERNHERWNPHLSTVQSEGTGSQSGERSSQSTWPPESSRVSKSSSMALNGRRSSDMPTIPSPPLPKESLDSPPLPSPPPVHRRDFTDSTIRVVTEQEDNVSKLQPIPGSRGSEYLGVPSAPEENRNSVIARPSSRASFFRDSIPAWAKFYYARPRSSSSLIKNSRNSRPSTSTDNISLNVFRPKTRNHREIQEQPHRNSMAINPITPRDIDVVEIRGPPRRRTSWSPHLWHNRTSLGRRRTFFQAPSIDEQAEGKTPSRRNAQVLLFVLGFIFPPAWFIASFFPLPPRPIISSVKGKNNASRAQIIEDLEKQLGPIDEARYENARWWRNINRILSLVGIVIVVAIITIAAVTAK